MSFREQKLGAPAVFLLPSLKLKGQGVEPKLHAFLMEHFGGYTAQAGNIFGYWRDSAGKDSYGEHRAFTVALTGEAKLATLKEYLGKLAEELREECIYLTAGSEVSLVYPEN